jgi:hypothetical protein
MDNQYHTITKELSSLSQHLLSCESSAWTLKSISELHKSEISELQTYADKEYEKIFKCLDEIIKICNKIQYEVELNKK